MTIDLNLQDPWLKAREIALSALDIPPYLSSTLRLLRVDSEREASGLLSSVGKYYLNQILRCDSVRIPVVFAGKTYVPHKFQGGDNHFNVDFATDLFLPRDVPALVCLPFFFRRLQKKCSAEEWDGLAYLMQRDADIGGFVGAAIPRVGLSTGVVAGAVPYVALAMLLAYDNEGYSDYRSYLYQSSDAFSLEWEMKRWGCTHIHLASALLLMVGMGVKISESICFGLHRPYAEALSSRWASVIVTGSWIESLAGTGLPPNQAHLGEYYPLEKDMEVLLQQVEEVKQLGSKYNWLEKGPGSIVESEEAYGDVPSDILAELSDEELRRLIEQDI